MQLFTLNYEPLGKSQHVKVGADAQLPIVQRDPSGAEAPVQLQDIPSSNPLLFWLAIKADDIIW